MSNQPTFPSKSKRGVTRSLAWMHGHPFASVGIALFLVPSLTFLLATGGRSLYQATIEPWTMEPRVEDFTPDTKACLPQTTQVGTNLPRPTSCNTPRTFTITCVRSNDPKHDARSVRLTALERRNLELACDFTPGWFDSDPRLRLVDDSEEADLIMHIRYNPTWATFGSFRFDARDTTNGESTTTIASTLSEGRHDSKAAYYAESAIRSLRSDGFLP